MPDLASLVLAVDSTAVTKGTASLDGLTAAGARAEAATVGLSGGFKGAGAEATAMAAAAQLSARAAVDQAAGFKVATDAARVNTLAMRETLVVARELSRGNFTRLPGSLTLLAQGIGSGGGLGNFASSIAQMLGLIKTVQNAELSEAATAAATAAAGVRAAAERAGGNILAADTELALAEAQLRVAGSSDAVVAAEARIAAAHEAAAAAATQARIAEEALARARGLEVEATTAANAATRTYLGSTGVAIAALAPLAVLAYGNMKQLQEQFKDTGELTRFRNELGLTHDQMLKLSDGVENVGGHIKQLTNVVPTMGDIFHGFIDTVENGGEKWTAFDHAASVAFNDIEIGAKAVGDAIGIAFRVAYLDTVSIWHNFGPALGDIFYSAVNVAIGAINFLVQKSVDGVNSIINGVNNSKLGKLTGLNIGTLSAPQLATVANPDAGASGKPTSELAANNIKAVHDQMAADQLWTTQLHNNVANRVKDRLSEEAQALKDQEHAKKAKKPNDHGLQEALDKLDAQIKGEWALVAAYAAGDAAVIKATALQKAEEDAISHKSSVGVFYEKELAKAVATTAAEAAKHLSDIRFETDERSKLNAAVAAGAITSTQANDQLKLETQLRPLQAALQVADAAHRGQILTLIQQTIAEQAKLNEVNAEAQALQQIHANDNDIAQLVLKNQLIGQSNAEIAVQLALLKEQQDLVGSKATAAQQATLLQQAGQKALLAAQAQDPLRQWVDGASADSAKIIEDLHAIETRGFDTLASGIAGVITGTENMGKVFKDVSSQIIGDLVQMIVKLLLVRALSGLGGSNVVDLTGSQYASQLGHFANGAAFSGGNVIPFATGGIVSSPTLFPMSGGSAGLMGERGPEAIMPLARDSSGRLGVRASNNNQSGPVVVEVRMVDQMLDARIVQGAGQVVQASAPAIITQAGKATVRALQRPKMMGR